MGRAVALDYLELVVVTVNYEVQMSDPSATEYSIEVSKSSDVAVTDLYLLVQSLVNPSSETEQQIDSTKRAVVDQIHGLQWHRMNLARH